MDRRLRRACAARVKELDRLNALHIGSLHEYLQNRRGRPIDVIPLDTLDAESPCGLWVATSTRDFVFYQAGVSLLHQVHILRHELAHILCGHTGILNPAQRNVMLPHLGAVTIERILGRSDYADDEEAEAELIASLIGGRVAIEGIVPAAAKELDPAVHRLLRMIE